MIQLAEDIDFLDYRKVPLDPKQKKLFIEIASNRKIDVAVVDSDELAEFEESDTGDDVGIDWFENIRSHDFEYGFASDQMKYYLLFWNSNEEKKALVAYKITPTK